MGSFVGSNPNLSLEEARPRKKRGIEQNDDEEEATPRNIAAMPLNFGRTGYERVASQVP